MARTSPSVQRVVSVLNLFAGHPEQAFTLTDVVRTLKLSRATCHGLLAGLVEAGYLYRANDKSYVLGAALLHVGDMAKSHFAPLKVARPEMRALADEFDAVCSAAFREGHEVVVRERAAAVSHLGYSSPRGTRLPLLPQFASPFFTRATSGELKEWIQGLDPPCSAEQMDAFRLGIAFIREHGYLFCIRRSSPFDTHNEQWLHQRAFSDTPLAPIYVLSDQEAYDLEFVVAPVFDANREVAFAITLTGLGIDKCSRADVAHIGARVREACDRISAFMMRGAAAQVHST